MRTWTAELGGYSYEFFIYHSYVAVNVKCHHTPKLTSALAIEKWERLPSDTQQQLEWRAWEYAQEYWWEHLRSTVCKDVRVRAEGRSGGYAVLVDFDVSALDQLIYDGEREPCENCTTPHFDGLGPDEHVDAERILSNPTPPLPFPDAPWELTCVNCQALYRDHVGVRCPYVLGHEYQPHRYYGYAIGKLNELRATVESIERYLEDAPRILDDELTLCVEDYEEPVGEDTSQ